jgi:hypothetical protein
MMVCPELDGSESPESEQSPGKGAQRKTNARSRAEDSMGRRERLERAREGSRETEGTGSDGSARRLGGLVRESLIPVLKLIYRIMLEVCSSLADTVFFSSASKNVAPLTDVGGGRSMCIALKIRKVMTEIAMFFSAGSLPNCMISILSLGSLQFFHVIRSPFLMTALVLTMKIADRVTTTSSRR